MADSFYNRLSIGYTDSPENPVDPPILGLPYDRSLEDIAASAVHSSVDDDRKKRQALAVIEGAEELAAGAASIVKIIKDAKYTLDHIHDAWNDLVSIYHKFFGSQPADTYVYQPEATVIQLSQCRWIEVGTFVSILQDLENGGVADLEERKITREVYKSVCEWFSVSVPFSLFDRFPDSGNYVCMELSGMNTKLVDIDNMLSFRLFGDNSKQFPLVLDAYYEAIQQLLTSLVPPSVTPSPPPPVAVIIYNQEIFEKTFNLTYIPPP